MLAAGSQNANPAVVSALIQAGANVNATDQDDRTVLTRAPQKNNISPETAALQLLKDRFGDEHPYTRAFDPNRHAARRQAGTGNRGKTALIYAVENHANPAVISALLQAGAEVNVADLEGKTALMLASGSKNANLAVVSALLRAGAEVNVVGKDGDTPLIKALRANANPDVIAALLQAGADETVTGKDGKSAATLAAEAAKGKIAFVTNTVSCSEEEYRPAQWLKAQYGHRVIHVTWPDNFMAEQEQMIEIVAKIAADPDVKALIINQAVPGTNAAVDKLLETRDDVFVVYCTPHENPSGVTARASLILLPDELGMGETMPVQAKKMGAKTFVHYSFPRHLSQPLLSARRELLRIKCEEIGLQFVDATAVDPTSDLGLPGAQQFILEDVPKMVAKYGKDTAFFTTFCAGQIPLIKAVVDTGAIYPQPCCPSPYHGFPAALGTQSDLNEPNNLQYVIGETRKIIAAAGMTGRVSTWAVSSTMAYSYVGFEYAMKIINGETPFVGPGGANIDKALVEQIFSEYAGVPVTMTALREGGKEYPNFLMNLTGYITY